MTEQKAISVSVQPVAPRLAMLGACLLFAGCVYGPRLGTVSDVVITSVIVPQYEDPGFLFCQDFKPTVREVTRFLSTAIVMGDIEDGVSREPCEAQGSARIDGVEAGWWMTLWGIGAATTYSPYRYSPLAMGGQRGVRRAHSRLLSLFGPDHFNPPPREKVSLDTRLRESNTLAGLPELQDGEVRIWWSSVNLFLGVSIREGELIQHLFSYRVSPANEKHGHSVWVRSPLAPASVQMIRNATTDIADLNEREIDCAQVLDGVTVQIEAMVNGAKVILQAQDPDEHTSDACRRVWVLEQLLWNAVNAQRAATPAR